MMSEIFLQRFRAELHVHLVDRLFPVRLHSVRDDIQESKNANLRAIDDFFFFQKKSLRAGCPGVDMW